MSGFWAWSPVNGDRLILPSNRDSSSLYSQNAVVDLATSIDGHLFASFDGDDLDGRVVLDMSEDGLDEHALVKITGQGAMDGLYERSSVRATVQEFAFEGDLGYRWNLGDHETLDADHPSRYAVYVNVTGDGDIRVLMRAGAEDSYQIRILPQMPDVYTLSLIHI